MKKYKLNPFKGAWIHKEDVPADVLAVLVNVNEQYTANGWNGHRDAINETSVANINEYLLDEDNKISKDTAEEMRNLINQVAKIGDTLQIFM